MYFLLFLTYLIGYEIQMFCSLDTVKLSRDVRLLLRCRPRDGITTVPMISYVCVVWVTD